MVSTDLKVTGDSEWQSSRIRRVRFAIDTGVRELNISGDDHGSSDRRRHTILPREGALLTWLKLYCLPIC